MPAGFTVRSLRDVLLQCKANDLQWGGPDHDIQHGMPEWCECISRQLEMSVAHTGRADANNTEVSGPEWRSRMVAVSALALQAIQSYDRRQSLTVAKALVDRMVARHLPMLDGVIDVVGPDTNEPTKSIMVDGGFVTEMVVDANR